MVLWTYNIFFFIGFTFLIGAITYYIARMVCGLSRVAESLILLTGAIAIFSSIYFFSQVVVKHTEYDLYEKMNLPEYSVQIMPKIHPYSEDLALEFYNKDTNVKINMKIKSTLDAEEIYQKIKDKQPSIDYLLKY